MGSLFAEGHEVWLPPASSWHHTAVPNSSPFRLLSLCWAVDGALGAALARSPAAYKAFPQQRKDFVSEDGDGLWCIVGRLDPWHEALGIAQGEPEVRNQISTFEVAFWESCHVCCTKPTYIIFLNTFNLEITLKTGFWKCSQAFSYLKCFPGCLCSLGPKRGAGPPEIWVPASAIMWSCYTASGKCPFLGALCTNSC